MPKVAYLHSSLSSKEQAKAFQPGPKIILSTNIAETSVTIPDVQVVIDTGRERQFSLLESKSEDIAVVGSQLATANISRASAKQRAGRAGRVSAGTCYRLYAKQQHDEEFEGFTKPEILRMDLSALVLHSLSMYHPKNGHSLHILQNTPDPPTEMRLSQTLRSLEHAGLVRRDLEDKENVTLAPLGRVVSDMPASPRIGRMLVMGLALRAIVPALNMAALLSVPSVFSPISRSEDFRTDRSSDRKYCSDIVKVMEEYQDFLEMDDIHKWQHPMKVEFDQVSRVKYQLQHAVKHFLVRKRAASRLYRWDGNGHRHAALAALICVGTPHIAHLVCGKNDFATRDVPGFARIHPSSVNQGATRRTHWYLYDQLRTTKAPYLHLTTAVSPFELALFSEASDFEFDTTSVEQYADKLLYIADQWVPVQISVSKQKEFFLRLRELLTNDMLQELAEDPESVVTNSTYQHIILHVLSAIEQQRMKK